jgi:hypothetical protein
MSKQFNLAKSTSFLFSVTNRNNLTYKVQTSSVGSINLGAAPFPMAALDGKVPGNRLDFTPLTIRVILSEDLTEWIDIYKWMVEITKTNNSHLESGEYGELTVLNSQNIPTAKFIYKNIWPTVIGDLQYSLVDDEMSLVVDVTFEYDTYDVEIVKTGERISYGSEIR